MQWAESISSALQLHKGDVMPKTWGAAARTTHILRLFRSYFCNSRQLLCRMFSPQHSPERVIIFSWHNLSICLRWKTEAWITQPSGRQVSWPQIFSQLLAAAEHKDT